MVYVCNDKSKITQPEERPEGCSIECEYAWSKPVAEDRASRGMEDRTLGRNVAEKFQVYVACRWHAVNFGKRLC